MFYEFYRNNYKKILNVFLALFTLFLFIALFKYTYTIAAPIFFGLLMFAIFEPFANFLHRKGIKKWIATSISTLSFILFFTGFSVLFSAIVLNSVQDFSKSIPQYADSIESFILTSTDFVQNEIEALPDDLVEKAKNEIASIIEKVSVFAASVLTSLVTTLSSSIMFIANVIIGFLFAVMLSIDIKGWQSFFASYAPKQVISAFGFLRENVVKGILTYLSAQLKLISVTFIVVLITLVSLNVENALTLAFLAGIFDVLPLLGVSTLFVPWIAYLFITGNTSLAIALTILLVVVLGTRQLLEPKITGDSLGVNASVMLLALVVSTNVLGFVGLFLSPILIILVKELIVQGHMDKWFGFEPRKPIDDTILTPQPTINTQIEGTPTAQSSPTAKKNRKRRKN